MCSNQLLEFIYEIQVYILLIEEYLQIPYFDLDIQNLNENFHNDIYLVRKSILQSG